MLSVDSMGEVVDGPLRHTVLHGQLRRGGVRRTDDEVAVHIRCRNRPIGQFFGLDVARGVPISLRNLRTCAASGGDSREQASEGAHAIDKPAASNQADEQKPHKELLS